jgi:oxygen-independent coproporphyrinogen-3 oxidase
VDAFNADTYRRCLRNRNIGSARSLALYVHHPFCDTVCYYCACNKIAARNHGLAIPYFGRVRAEMRLLAAALGQDRRIKAMHWGGGTPTFAGMDALAELAQALRGEFDFHAQGEYSIEIDPRRIADGDFQRLAAMGFNRASFGVQDFSAEVQAAVNRLQSFEQTLAAMQGARAAGFRSLNLDLILGLPKQTHARFEYTLERTLQCAPDRIALYNYAHLPQVFKPQRRILSADLPSAEAKLDMLLMAVRRLTEAGYEYIGMDHFAKPGDELAVARREGRLRRDFQGYSSLDLDTVGLGLSAISSIGPAYSQNAKNMDDYNVAVDQGELPVARGLELSADDALRRAVIQALACQFVVSKEAFSVGYLIDFDRYFAAEGEALAELEQDGLIEADAEWITVTPRGRLLVRSVCMVFDRYLQTDRQRSRYSRIM